MRICKIDRAEQIWGRGGPAGMGSFAGFGSLGLTATAAQPSFAAAGPGVSSAWGSEASFTATSAESSTASTYDSPYAGTSFSVASSSELSSAESHTTQDANAPKPTPDIRHFDSGVTNGVRDDGQPLGYGCGDAARDAMIPDKAYGIDLTDACVKHDKAYSICGAPKVEADLAFRSDLYDDCRAQEGSVATCAFISFTYSTAVLLGGEKAYDAAQEVACRPPMSYPSTASEYGTLGNGTYDPQAPGESCRASDYSSTYSSESNDSNSYNSESDTSNSYSGDSDTPSGYSSDSSDSSSYSSGNDNPSSDSSSSSASTSNSSSSDSSGSDSSSSDSGGGSGSSD
jgi:hypothetical protein